MIRIFCDCCKNEMELTEKFDIIIKSLNPTNFKDTYHHEVCSKCAYEMLTKLFQDERVSSESSFVKKYRKCSIQDEDGFSFQCDTDELENWIPRGEIR